MNFAVVFLFFQLLAAATTNISFCSGSSDAVHHGRRQLKNTPIDENYEDSKLSAGIKKLPWKNLEYLDLRSNLFEGPVPVPPPSLKVFLISNNKFTGKIPQLICNTTNIEVLDLSNNSLTGTIPECIGNFSNSLQILDLRKNRFQGMVPANFKKDNGLKTLNFNGNELEGTVPRTLLNCANLEVLDLGNNMINDSFPHWLETLPQLQVLVLRSNKFHGVLNDSKANFNFSKLKIIDISNNSFSGSFPTKYFKNLKAMMNAGPVGERRYMGDNNYYENSVTLTIKRFEVKLERIFNVFTTIDFSKNQFHGEIPELIGKLHSLILLNLSQNFLTGNIPSSLGDLTNLEALDLSSNKLDGKIPWQLENLNFLGTLNLSQNNLRGPIPPGNHLSTFANDSYSGNPRLCGFPLSKNCSSHEPSQASLLEDHPGSENGFGWKSVLMGYLFGTIFGTIMGYAMISNGKPQWLVRIVEGKHHRKKGQNNKGKGRRSY